MWTAPRHFSCLIIAPHPDDEVLGCGGLIAALARELVLPSVVYLTGSNERRAEGLSAARALGIEKPATLHLTEGNVARSPEALARLGAVIGRSQVDALLVPALEDVHPDHVATHQLVAEVLDPRRPGDRPAPREIWTYEGFSPLHRPNRWIDITAVADQKWRALQAFESQQRLYRLSEVATHLNRYRALTTFRRGIQYAEAYRTWTLDDYVRTVKGGERAAA